MKHIFKSAVSLCLAAVMLSSALAVSAVENNSDGITNAAEQTVRAEKEFNYKDSFSGKVTVQKDGDYKIQLTYISKGTQDISLALKVDGKSLSEASENVVFPCWWMNENENWQTDFSSQYTPEQIAYDGEVCVTARNFVGKGNSEYTISLNAGAHEISFTVNSGKFLLKKIALAPYEEPSRYSVKELKTTDTKPIIIEAEACKYKNNRSLIPLADGSSPLVHPSNATEKRLNYIGGSMWSSDGQSICWEIDVPADGYYSVGFEYRQSQNVGQISYRSLSIDGKIPFAEAEKIKFSYGNTWQYLNWEKEEANPYYLYLTKGKHILSLTATSGDFSKVYASLQETTAKMGDLYVDITKVVGETVDIYRSYELFNSIPHFNGTLDELISALKKITEQLNSLQDNKTSSSISTVKDSIRVIQRMRDNPYSAHKYKSQFYDAYTNLSALMTDITDMPLDLDRIVLSGYKSTKSYDSKDVSFTEKLRFSVRKFLNTFLDDYNTVSATDNGEEALTIWINWGRDQAEALNSIISDDFVRSEGIPVNVKLVNASLINAILAGSGPDCLLQMSRTEPVNLAMRGVLVDLSKFDDFNEVSQRFCADATVPYAYRDGIYALPVTQCFFMMFMRDDILKKMKIETPKTWDEFINAASVLQRNNLEAVIPYTQLSDSGTVNAGVGGLSLYPTLLLQKGSSIYNDKKNATAFTEIDRLQTFVSWTELYTKYKMPIIANFFNRFRIGSAPLGIASYSLYTELKAAAPEIDGRWSMTQIPGTAREDGTVDRSSAAWGAGCAITTLSKNPENAWKFLKWWTSSKIQLKYSSALETVLGPLGRVTTANMEAFSAMDWDATMYEQMVSQQKNTREIEEIPGGYYTARGIDQAFWNVTEGGKDPTEQIKKWAKIVDGEIKRKKAEYENE